MAPIISAFGLYDGPALTGEANAEQTSKRHFYSSISMPFQSKISFEKVTCHTYHDAKSEHLRVRVNEMTHPAAGQSWCPVKQASLAHHQSPWLDLGLCPLDAVLSALEWVNTDTEWQKCSTNTTSDS